MLKVCLLVACSALPSLAGSKDGRKVDAPSWVNKPPTSDKGLYGVGIAQAKELPQATAQADLVACKEISAAAGNAVAAWIEKSRENGDQDGQYSGLDATVAGLDVGQVACQIQKREQRQDADGSYRAYALGYLGHRETVAVVKAAQARKFQKGAQGSQDELDRALQNAPAPQD